MHGDTPPDPEVLPGFCVIEGLDGSGTTTQLDLIAHRLREDGVSCHATCEPTCGFVGKQIREVLRGGIPAGPQTIALLFAADRAEHVSDIRRRLDLGELVVTDRYLFSSLAYQSLGCDFGYVAELNRGFPLPSHLIFLDTPLAVSEDRLRQRETTEIYESQEIQPRILENYERAMRYFSQTAMRIHRMDGTASPDSICREIHAILRG